MKALVIKGVREIGMIEKEKPVCGPNDAICKPIALAPCTSDIHTVWSGAIGDRHEIVKNKQIYLNEARINGLTYADGTPITTGYYNVDADGKMIKSGFVKGGDGYTYYYNDLVRAKGFTKIGEKVVQHRKREFGESKFGLNRFINGYLDLMTLWFLNKFGKQPMHFFGLVGSIMFILGFIAIIVVGAMKLYALAHGVAAMLVGVNPYFHLSILMMILGCMLFLAGFLGELIIRNSSERNNYLIKEEF